MLSFYAGYLQNMHESIKKINLKLRAGSINKKEGIRLIRKIRRKTSIRIALMINTEVVKAYNLAVMETLNEEDIVIWRTVGGPRVRDTHRRRNGKRYRVASARALLGEPNCRCSVVPYKRRGK